MAYIKYGLLAAVLLIVTVLVVSTPAKESIQAWRPEIVLQKQDVVSEQPVGNSILSASPTLGNFPLDVVVKGFIKDRFCFPPRAIVDGGTDYTVEYSDGQKDRLPAYLPSCSDTFSLKHTFTKAGVYTITLVKTAFVMGETESSQVLSTATVTVH